MEKLGEIMKSCENCKYSTEYYTGCSDCIKKGIHINWKPVETFQPLLMEEIKVEDYEVTTQADGLVKLMTKVDEKPIIKIKVKTWDEIYFEHITKFSLEVLKRAKEVWDESKIELVLPENRIIEVYPHNKEQYYYEGFYITKSFTTEITESTVDSIDLDNPEHPVKQELLPELNAFNLEKQAKARENLLKFCDKATLTNNNLAIFKQIQNKSHLCHYTKFQLDYDINTSIRFIHAFDGRPELVGKFIYKHHEEKLFSVIEPQLAEHFIKTQCSNEAEEFINRYVGQGKGKKYRRIKVTENSLTKFFES